MPAKRVTTVTVPVDGRCGVVLEAYPARTPLLSVHDLVFPSGRGTPMEPDNLRRSWYAIRKDASLGQTRVS